MEILCLVVGAFIAGFMFTLGKELNLILIAPLYRKINNSVANKKIKIEGKEIEHKPYKSTKIGFCTETLK